MDKRRQTQRSTRDVKDRLGRFAAAYHVHVDRSLDALRELRLGVEQSGCAFDLRRPDEADGPRRARQLAFMDQLLQRACDLEDGHASAGIVIRAWTLVVEMAAVGNLFVFEFGIGAGDHGRGYFQIPRMLPRADRGMKTNLLASCQAVTQGASGLQ